MRSIAQALLWEMSVRGRWQILMFFLLGDAIPLLVYFALGRAAVDTGDPAFVMMHVMFLPLVMFHFAVGVVAAQGTLSRLYLAPISTAELVAWHMFPGSLLLAGEVALILWIENLYFGFSFPIFGPSIFAAAAWSASQLFVCLSHRTFTGFAVALAPIIAMFGWLNSRYGAWFAQPEHYWTEVTISEILTLLSVVVVSYLVTVRAIARDRCGEYVPSRKFLDWLARIWEKIVSLKEGRSQPFSTPMQAQLWYEWRCRGVGLPIIVSLAIFVFTIVFVGSLIVLGDPMQRIRDLQEALAFCGAVFPVAATLSGLLLGSISGGTQVRHHNSTLRSVSVREDFDQMGSFPASLPTANTTWAAVILRTAVKSTGLSWGLCLGVLGIVMLAGYVAGVPHSQFLAFDTLKWYLPLTLLAAWTGMANVSTTVLSGRFTIFATGFVVLVFTAICGSVLVEQLASDTFQHQLVQILIVLISSGILSGTMIAFIRARRRGLVKKSEMYQSLLVWLTVSGLTMVLPPAPLAPLACLSMVAFASLAVLPVATIPMAIAWNRHR